MACHSGDHTQIGINQFSQIIYVAIEISQSIILNNGNTSLALYMDEIVSINKDVSSLGLKWIL